MNLPSTIIKWFHANARELPWRSQPDPWAVMVSEFMLQQTPVNRVLPVFNEWMDRWPTVEDFANASTADVLRAWGRLGYPRRALRLHAAAHDIVTKHGGVVPHDLEELRALPGVGEYTAAAIASFGYQQSHIVLDTNVRRLFARVFNGVETNVNHVTNAEREQAQKLIPPNNGHLWAAATMELGALICKPNPLCDQCPIASECKWRAIGYPASTTPTKRTQTWHGTDRQCRGTIMALLRESDEPVAKVVIDAVWPDQEQLTRALFTLSTDGLIQQTSDDHYALGQ